MTDLDLNKQLESHKVAIDGLNAQLDAVKQMFNEASNSNLLLRANSIMFQKQIKELFDLLQEKDKIIEELKGKQNASDTLVEL